MARWVKQTIFSTMWHVLSLACPISFLCTYSRVYTLIMRGVSSSKIASLLLMYNHRKKHFSFLERWSWEQKRVIISASSACCITTYTIVYQQSRWWPWENKIISGKSENSFPERLRKKDLLVHNTYLLLLCIFFLYYFLSGTRQSAKNSFHIMPDNKHTHTHTNLVNGPSHVQLVI